MVNFSPVPTFPEYTGPYKVGSIDLEIPVKQLGPAVQSPDPNVTTLSVRIFYPCEEPSKPAPKTFWYPNPQQDYFAAYLKFLGSSAPFASFLSLFPRILYYISIPVSQNARLHEPPTTTKRWPTMVFSHGLGGTRNMYSQICGSIASHGAVVFAPEHRDGSAPTSFIRAEDGKVAHTVTYQNIPHENTDFTQRARNCQLKQRLWEIGETYSLAQALDKGVSFTNHAPNKANGREAAQKCLGTFRDSLNVHDPGAVHFCGHSFGAATSLQFVKSVFYDPAGAPSDYEPLYQPPRDSQVVRQITPYTNLTLLDCWMLPTLDPSTSWLHDRPVPAYSEGGPGGSVVLSILSEGFYRWTDNLMEHKRAVSPDPSLQPREWTAERLSGVVAPRIFYPVKSAHLSQSDFGILFPWFAKKAFGAEEPQRTLTLNVRAILEVWRGNGAELADTCQADMEAVQAAQTESEVIVNKPVALRRSSSQATLAPGVPVLSQDEKILLRDGRVRGWIALTLGQEDPEHVDEGAALQRKDPGRVLKEGANQMQVLAAA